MGTHATAYLAYGIPIDEGEIPPNLNEDQWEELREEWNDEAIAARGFEIIYHCHYDYTMYFLAIPDSEAIAWQGRPKKIDALPMYAETSREEWEQAMRKLGVDTANQGWYMMSHYG